MDTAQNGPADGSRPDSPEPTGTHDDGAPGAQPASYLPPRPPSEPDDSRRRRSRRWWLLAAAAAVLAVVVLVLVPFITSQQGGRDGESLESAPAVSRNADPGVDGIVARGVPPVQLEPGDCLTDLESVSDPATVVECDREHEAQLVGRKLWPTERAFPEDMQGDAKAFCATIELAGTDQAQVVVEISHPAEGTWAEGDRRVDCVAVAQDGRLTASLVAEPVFEDWTTHDDGPSPSASASPSTSG